MKRLKKLNRDILYKVILKTLEGCSEYCLVDANDSDEVYIILDDCEVDEWINAVMMPWMKKQEKRP